MSAALTIHLNGQSRTLEDLKSPTDLTTLVEALGLKADRIAVEHNGRIVPRAAWALSQIAESDRLEIVHFVGGGRSVDLKTLEAQTAGKAISIRWSIPFWYSLF